MKTLLLLRHAKSSHDQPGISDHDRGLTERGKRDAQRVGEQLRERGLGPDLVLASTARRARKTAKQVVKAAGWEVERQLCEDLYLAAPQAYISRLGELPSHLETVLVVGHNPGLEELVYRLTGAVRPLPTTGLVQLEVPVESWSDFHLATQSRIAWSWTPREDT